VPSNHRADWRIHRIVPGETLAEIARHYSTSVASIASANQGAGLEQAGSAAPVAGDLLVVPAMARFARTTAPHNNAAASHTKRPSKVLTARKTPSNVPARKVRSSPYRTASLSTKHRAAVN
jgi:LysM domain